MTGWEAKDRVLAGRCLTPVMVYPVGQPQMSLTLAGMLDTGAQRSAISKRAAQAVGLIEVDRRRVASPIAGLGLVPVYQCILEFLTPALTGQSWVIAPYILDGLLAPIVGTDLLIGMDIIGHGSLTISDGIWALSFPHSPRSA